MIFRYKFKTQILLISLISIFFVAITCLTFFGITIKRHTDFLYKQTALVFNNLSNDISDGLSDITNLVNELSINEIIQQEIRNINNTMNRSEKIYSMKLIEDEAANYYHSNIINLQIFSLNDTIESVGEQLLVNSYIKDSSVWGKTNSLFLPSNKTHENVLFIRPILSSKARDFLVPLGIIVAEINLQNIIKYTMADNDISYENSLFYIGEEEITLYSGITNSYLKIFQDTISAISLKYDIQKINDEQFFIVKDEFKIADSTWQTALGLPYSNIFNSITSSQTLALTSMLASIIIALLLAQIFQKNINHKFYVLLSKMNKLKGGNFDVVDETLKLEKDELSILNTTFDEMVVQFKNVTEENYAREILLRETKLEILKQQINPHFLYNTLETISWLSKKGHTESIPMIINSLSSLLRSGINSNKNLNSIREEIDLISKYIFIQQVRFPDSITVVYNIDSEVENILIPKFSIQPLVENAINYSMESLNDICSITIRATSNDALATISVENSNTNIDEDIIGKLKRGEVLPMGMGIGLNNINDRLALIYGKGYGLKVENVDKGVQISFSVPLVSTVENIGEKKETTSTFINNNGRGLRDE